MAGAERDRYARVAAGRRNRRGRWWDGRASRVRDDTAGSAAGGRRHVRRQRVELALQLGACQLLLVEHRGRRTIGARGGWQRAVLAGAVEHGVRNRPILREAHRPREYLVGAEADRQADVQLGPQRLGQRHAEAEERLVRPIDEARVLGPDERFLHPLRVPALPRHALDQQVCRQPPPAVVLVGVDARRDPQRRQVELLEQPYAAALDAELQEVGLQPELRADQLTEAVHQRLGRHPVLVEQRRQRGRLPGRQPEEGPKVGHDTVARQQESAREVGRLEVVQDLLERILAVGRRRLRSGLESQQVVARLARQHERLLELAEPGVQQQPRRIGEPQRAERPQRRPFAEQPFVDVADAVRRHPGAQGGAVKPPGRRRADRLPEPVGRVLDGGVVVARQLLVGA